MGRLLKREWTYDKGSLLKQFLPGMILSLLVLILYKIDRRILLAMARGIFRFPKEIYGLFGLKEGLATGSFGFYLLFFALFINFWMVWDSCSRMITGVYRDVRGDGLYSLMNQLYSKEQLAFGKYSAKALGAVFQVTVWNVFLMVVILLGSGLAQQRSQGILTIFRLYVISLAVHIFFLSASFLLAIWKAGRGREMSPAGLLLGSLFVGNAWKGRDVLLLLFENIHLSEERIRLFGRLFGWLDGLYWVSPLSWMNPMQLQTGGVLALQMVLLFAASGCFVVLGIRLYGPGK